MIAKFLAVSLAASCIFAVGLARAAYLPPAAPAPTLAATPARRRSPEAYIVTVQVIGAVTPSFPGSSVVRPYPFPGFSVRAAGEPERFSAPDDGFGVPVFEADGLRAGPVANFVFRRGERDGLHGVQPVGLTHEVGGFVEYFAFDHFRARAELRQAVDGHEGFVASLGADFYGEANSFRLSVGPRLNLGDNRYANAYFSVTPVEAILNGRLEPSSGHGRLHRRRRRRHLALRFHAQSERHRLRRAAMADRQRRGQSDSQHGGLARSVHGGRLGQPVVRGGEVLVRCSRVPAARHAPANCSSSASRASAMRR